MESEETDWNINLRPFHEVWFNMIVKNTHFLLKVEAVTDVTMTTAFNTM
jgi:hypothetical protein